MNTRKSLWIVPSLLLAMQTAPIGTALAQDAGDARWAKEFADQDAIYQGRGERLLKGYVIDRSLASYVDTLPTEFNRSLSRLGPAQRWLDIGAGQGRAVLDYIKGQPSTAGDEKKVQGPGKGSAVAISIEDRRTAEWHQAAQTLEPHKIEYLFGRTLREYSAQELGQFQVITDVIGGFSYTPSLDQYMQKALALLVVGGDFYTVLQDVHAESGENKPFYEKSPYLTEITDAGGAEIKVCTWLRGISCVQVTCRFKADWEPPIEVYHIHKQCEEIRVPALDAVHFQAGTPPERRFRTRAPALPAAEDGR
jgi:SAM-dependent methyltransferase